MKSKGFDSEQITYRDVSLYLLGKASESVTERIEADLDRPDSQVMAFLNWVGDPGSNTPVVQSAKARSGRITFLGKTGAVVASALLACFVGMIFFNVYRKVTDIEIVVIKSEKNPTPKPMITEAELIALQLEIYKYIDELSSYEIDPSNIKIRSEQLLVTIELKDRKLAKIKTSEVISELDKLISQLDLQATKLAQSNPITSQDEQKIKNANRAIIETIKYRRSMTTIAKNME